MKTPSNHSRRTFLSQLGHNFTLAPPTASDRLTSASIRVGAVKNRHPSSKKEKVNQSRNLSEIEVNKDPIQLDGLVIDIWD